MAAVECSVSGEFFSALPKVSILIETPADALSALTGEGHQTADLAAESMSSQERGKAAALNVSDPAAHLTQAPSHRTAVACSGDACALVELHNAIELRACLSEMRHADELLSVRSLQPRSASTPTGGHALETIGGPSLQRAARHLHIALPQQPSAHGPWWWLRPWSESTVEMQPAALSAAVAQPLADARAAGASEPLPPPLHAPSLDGRWPSGWQADGSGARSDECLLYIHGFSCPTAEALKRLGQLLALGRFPPHLKPLVYSWPTGKLASYFAASRSAASPEVAADLRAVLRAIKASGIRDVHVLTHSMGAAVLAGALEQIEGEFEAVSHRPLGAPAGEAQRLRETGAVLPNQHTASRAARSGREADGGEAAEGGMPGGHLRLVSVSMANPELFEDSFWSGPFQALSRICTHITLYGDEEDGALFWSEYINRRKCVGRLHGAPYRLPTASGAPAADDGSARLEAGLGSPPSRAEAWADVDVIDMTWLEANVHAIRHNSFGLNRMMVDDLREVMVDRRRAAHRRSRLVRKIGNVFSFLQPPPHVVNG
jgi:hypothetical protein